MCSSSVNRDLTADFFRLMDADLPAIGVHDSASDASYLLRGPEFTPGQIASFLDGIKNGTVTNSFSSEL